MRGVIVYRMDGLGGRLMALGNGIRIARVLGVPCYFAWESFEHVAGVDDPRRLLDAGRLDAAVKTGNLTFGFREFGARRILYDGANEVIDRAGLAGAHVLLCGLGRVQRLSDEADSARLRLDLAAAMSAIALAPALHRRALAFAARHDPRPAIGVHVRRGDLIGYPVPRERRRLVGLDRYFAVLDAVSGDAPLFVCTEDQSVIEAFETRYSGRILRYPTRSWDRGDQEALAEALIEMFLLSTTRFIVGGPSAFSRFAAARNALPLAVLSESHSVERSVEIAIAVAGAAHRLWRHRQAAAAMEQASEP
jgi:hypothetical protein